VHIHFLDPYRPRSSPLHALDGRVKLILALAFILTVSLTPFKAWPVLIILYSLAVALEILSDLGIRYVHKRAVLALPFVLAALPLIFSVDGTSLLRLPWGLRLSQEGVLRFVAIAFKSWVSVQMAILLAATTPFPDLLIAMRAIGVPRLLVAIFGLMWRYMFVLADEALRLLRARAARSSESGQPGVKSGGRLTWRARVAGGMAGSLFLRAYERSDRIYMAMLARGYDGEVRAMPLPAFQSQQRWVLIGGLGLLGLLLMLGYLL